MDVINNERCSAKLALREILLSALVCFKNTTALGWVRALWNQENPHTFPVEDRGNTANNWVSLLLPCNGAAFVSFKME